MKNNLTKLKDLHISALLEETFHVSCQKTQGTCHHMQNQSRRQKKNSRTAFCTIASLPRVKESRWQLQTGAKGRSIRPRRRETSSSQTREHETITSDKEGEKFYRETMNVMAKQCEGLGGQYLADSATLPSAVVKAARAKRNQQPAFVITIEKLLARGKKSEGLDCLFQELAETWWQVCDTLALVVPRWVKCTTESMIVRIVDSIRRHLTQDVFGRMPLYRRRLNIYPK